MQIIVQTNNVHNHNVASEVAPGVTPTGGQHSPSGGGVTQVKYTTSNLPHSIANVIAQGNTFP